MSEPDVVSVVAQYPGWCMSCGAEVNIGDGVKWLKNIGVWHEECPPPRSLSLYKKEAG